MAPDVEVGWVLLLLDRLMLLLRLTNFLLLRACTFLQRAISGLKFGASLCDFLLGLRDERFLGA